jgi:hypothetical protein
MEIKHRVNGDPVNEGLVRTAVPATRYCRYREIDPLEREH